MKNEKYSNAKRHELGRSRGSGLHKSGEENEDMGNTVQANAEDIIRFFRVLCKQFKVPQPKADYIARQLETSSDESNRFEQLIIAEEIGSRPIIAICLALGKLFYMHLKILCVWRPMINTDCAQCLCETVKFLHQIRRIELTDCNIGAQPCRALARSIRSLRPNLLRLDHNPIGIAGLKAITNAVMLEGNLLSTFSVAFCDLPSESGEIFANMLKYRNCNLRSLDVEGNHLGDVGIVKLSEGLVHNRSILSINISDNRFGKDRNSCIQLCDAIRNAQQLTSVNIDGNMIGDDGAKLFLEALHRNPQILHFNISAMISSALMKEITSELHSRVTNKMKRSSTVRRKPQARLLRTIGWTAATKREIEVHQENERIRSMVISSFLSSQRIKNREQRPLNQTPLGDC